MNIISSAKPRYPEVLRQSGVGGRVLVQFTVDSDGPGRHGIRPRDAVDARPVHAQAARSCAPRSVSSRSLR